MLWHIFQELIQKKVAETIRRGEDKSRTCSVMSGVTSSSSSMLKAMSLSSSLLSFSLESNIVQFYSEDVHPFSTTKRRDLTCARRPSITDNSFGLDFNWDKSSVEPSFCFFGHCTIIIWKTAVSPSDRQKTFFQTLPNQEGQTSKRKT